MKKIGRKIICIVVVLSILFSLYYVRGRGQTDPDTFFTKAELETLESLNGQDITLGHIASQEADLTQVIAVILRDQLFVNVEVVQYDTFEEIELAAINGEVDFFIDLNANRDSDVDFYTLSFPVLNEKFFHTHRNK